MGISLDELEGMKLQYGERIEIMIDTSTAPSTNGFKYHLQGYFGGINTVKEGGTSFLQFALEEWVHPINHKLGNMGGYPIPTVSQVKRLKVVENSDLEEGRAYSAKDISDKVVETKGKGSFRLGSSKNSPFQHFDGYHAEIKSILPFMSPDFSVNICVAAAQAGYQDGEEFEYTITIKAKDK